MQLCVVFLFEQLFCYERRVPTLFLGRDSGGIRPMVDLVSVLEGYVPPMWLSWPRRISAFLE